MTIKAEKLLKNYTEKLDIELWLYDKNIIPFEKAKEDLKKEHDRYIDCLENALHFGLISIREFEELWAYKPYDAMMTRYDKLIALHYSNN